MRSLTRIALFMGGFVAAGLLYVGVAKADEFKCHPAPELQVIGQLKDDYIGRVTKEGMSVTEDIHADAEKLRFDFIKGNLITNFGEAPWPYDEMVLLKATPGGPIDHGEEATKTGIVYLYKGCVLNWGIFPKDIKTKIFGNES